MIENRGRTLLSCRCLPKAMFLLPAGWMSLVPERNASLCCSSSQPFLLNDTWEWVRDKQPAREISQQRRTRFSFGPGKSESRSFLPSGQMEATNWAGHGPLLLQSPTLGEKGGMPQGLCCGNKSSQDSEQWLGSDRAGLRGTLPSRLSCLVFAFEPLAGLGHWHAPARQVLLLSSL